MYATEPLPHFVEDYLAYLREVHPTTATFDGLHVHDDLVEDFSRPSLEQHARELGGFARRLDNIKLDTLTPTERVERPVLDHNIRARLFEIEEIRTWERDPRIYAEILALSLAAQTLFQYASPEERARRVLSKLRQASKVRDATATAPASATCVGDGAAALPTASAFVPAAAPLAVPAVQRTVVSEPLEVYRPRPVPVSYESTRDVRRPVRTKTKSAVIIGSSTAIGATIGGLTKGTKGAIIGGIVGGGAATVWDQVTRRQGR